MIVIARSLVLATLAGLLAGVAASLFLWTLAFATETREAHPQLIYALPLAGLFIGWVYHRYGKDVAPGNNLVLDEIHEPTKTIPLRMAPLVLLGTCLTHLCGGSAGREGTAVQMGASLADQVARKFSATAFERRRLLVCGAGAGFGAAIGTPLAGMLFGLEVLSVGRFSFDGAFESIIASLVAYSTALFLRAPHSVFPSIEIPAPDLQISMYIAIAGVAFGLAALVFVALTHAVEKLEQRFISIPPLKPFIAGLVLVALYHLEGSFRYVGLGIPYIQQALGEKASWTEPLYKAIFTALTVGSGFKGGEFVPLVFIGTTLGSYLSTVLPVSVGLLGAVGFAAVFGAAANTPLACALMCMELFGYAIAPYAIIGCVVAYMCSGPKGIYPAQRRPMNRLTSDGVATALGSDPKRNRSNTEN